jgi:hypothetical protein
MKILIFLLTVVVVGSIAFLFHASLVSVCVWIGSLFVLFAVITHRRHKRILTPMAENYAHMRATYKSRFGSLRTAKQFLEALDAQPRSGWGFSNWGRVAYMASDMDPVSFLLSLALAPIIGGVGRWISKFRDDQAPPKTADQIQLENSIVTTFQQVNRHRESFRNKTVVSFFIALFIPAAYALIPTLSEPTAPTTVTQDSPSISDSALPATPVEPPTHSLSTSIEPSADTSLPATVVLPPALDATPLPREEPKLATPQPATTVADAQRAAVQRHPELGVAGSKLNSEFVARYRRYQRTRPEYFRDPSWPLHLAEELTQTP